MWMNQTLLSLVTTLLIRATTWRTHARLTYSTYLQQVPFPLWIARGALSTWVPLTYLCMILPKCGYLIVSLYSVLKEPWLLYPICHPWDSLTRLRQPPCWNWLKLQLNPSRLYSTQSWKFNPMIKKVLSNQTLLLLNEFKEKTNLDGWGSSIRHCKPKCC
jgi:hypothetical protein